MDDIKDNTNNADSEALDELVSALSDLSDKPESLMRVKRRQVETAAKAQEE